MLIIYQLPGDSKYISNISYFVVSEREAKAMISEILDNKFKFVLRKDKKYGKY